MRQIAISHVDHAVSLPQTSLLYFSGQNNFSWKIAVSLHSAAVPDVNACRTVSLSCMPSRWYIWHICQASALPFIPLYFPTSPSLPLSPSHYFSPTSPPPPLPHFFLPHFPFPISPAPLWFIYILSRTFNLHLRCNTIMQLDYKRHFMATKLQCCQFANDTSKPCN